MIAFEMKWRKRKASLPSLFSLNYPEAQFQIINQDNYIQWLNQ